MSHAARRLCSLAVAAALLALGLVCAVPPAPAHATIVVHLTLAELTEQASVIAVATVTNAQSRWNDEGNLIVTDVSLRVEEALAGCTEGETLVLETAGGRVDRFAQVVGGVPSFEVGERVVVFLDRPASDSGALRLVGLGQGKYTLATTAASPEVELALPAVEGLTFARVTVTAEPSAPEGVRRVVEALDVPVDFTPVPAQDFVAQVRALVDARRR